MCLIIDANKLAVTFSEPRSEPAKPILEWLFKKDGCLVYGGTKMAKEIERVGEARRSLLELVRAGRARKCDDARVDAEQATVAHLCRSDDSHVIALARVSGARVLYSGDENLHCDFKNRALVDKPRGKVYQTSAHLRSLRHSRACKSQMRSLPQTESAERR